jgi:hypothetical protein
MSPPTFTPEGLRGFALLHKLPTETLDLLAVRLDKLDASYPHDPTHMHVEIGLFPYPLCVNTHSDYGPTTGHRPTAIATDKHRWHDLAWQIDGVLREISGLKLGYPSDGGPTTDFIAWAIKKITGETVGSGTIATTLRRLRRLLKLGNVILLAVILASYRSSG